MARTFNTTGPCDPARHYMLPAEGRLPDLLPLVHEQLYFTLHAPRQTGKTTAMLALAERLRGEGYAAIWVTFETSQGATDEELAEPRWLFSIAIAADALPASEQPPDFRSFLQDPVGERLRSYLRSWGRACTKPVVLLIDEADTVTGSALVSLLRQLRAGFSVRGAGRFPVSIVLIGMRDLRDYLTAAKDGVSVNPGSPFNIKKHSLTLRNFSEADVASLLGQHSVETGQVFTEEAVAKTFWWTGGQPFLVNALADSCVRHLDPTERITAKHIDEAKERLILSRTTHLDSLGYRLREERVARVVRAVLLGDTEIPYGDDDYLYCLDLGLLANSATGAVPANPIYQEVLARELTTERQMNLPAPWWRWQLPSGALDMPGLIDAFVEWWRENAEIVETNAPRGYLEAVAHLTFMAFVQRVVNGGGRVFREYAAGRQALDLLVEYAGGRHVIELKRVPPKGASLETIKKRGTAQTARYLATVGEAEGWLVIFDQRPGLTWDERLWREEAEVAGVRIHLVGA